VDYLGRQAGPGEESGMVQELLAGRTEEFVLSQFFNLPEFYARAQLLVASGTADERYVQALYESLYHRTASPAELSFVVGLLPSEGRQGVALEFLQSPEFRRYQFEGYYNALLHRPDNPDGIDPNGLTAAVFSAADMAAVRLGFEGGVEFYFNG